LKLKPQKVIQEKMFNCFGNQKQMVPGTSRSIWSRVNRPEMASNTRENTKQLSLSYCQGFLVLSFAFEC
jgi:hypothetical protein